jgi:hypothetical protein
MKRLLYLPVLMLIVASCTSVEPVESKLGPYLYSHKAMPMDTVNSQQYKWDHKQVSGSIQLDGMESLDNWVLTFGNRENVASVSLTDEKVLEGKSSIRFVSPTKLEVSTGTGGRYWGRQNLTRKFNENDLSEYNRIAVNVYPVFKGFRKLYLTLILNNDGNVPDKYGKEGCHTVMLKNNQWNKMVMEIPHLPHDKVTGITISYGLQGNEADAADTIIYYLDNLVLEKVDADYYEGWGTEDEISFTHAGYNSNDKKMAFSSNRSGKTFKVVGIASNKTILEKEVQNLSGRTGDFSLFDFSEIKEPGTYRIVYGNTESQPFPVDNDVWYLVIEKITNQYFLQRCGFDQPGIHLKCHTDWYTVHDGDTIVMAGGWHDAGDLSQSYWQTASGTAAFFRLARHYQDIDKKLSERLVEEGLWGLEWLHKNKFDSLQVISWTTHDCYTDGVIGNFDDKPIQPDRRINSNDNYHSIIADVEAFLTLRKTDPDLAKESLHYATEYWEMLSARPSRWNTERLSLAVLAGARLYGATGNEDIKNLTISYADSLMKFQHQDIVNWTLPLSGFFYQGRSTDRFFGYNHSCIVSSPILGFVELCKILPRHEKYKEWYKAVELHARYLKSIAQTTSPYYMFPANIYKMNGTEDTLQIKEGLKLDKDHYLRMFPVWGEFRGNSSIILSQGIGLAAANQILKDPEMHMIALSQVEWMLGKNPFSQSLMFGEGYGFSPQYAVFTGDITGGLPVGILTRENLDIPYWKMPVLHNYKELWGQPAFRMMELLYELYD